MGKDVYKRQDRDCITTGTLTDLFCNAWGEKMTWENHWAGGPHEANFLKLDCSKIKTVFGWTPRYTVKTAIEKMCIRDRGKPFILQKIKNLPAHCLFTPA